MTDKQYYALADIIGLIMASTLVTVSLIHLVPNGMWLHLVYLGTGIVIITNKINRVLRGK